MVVTTDLTAYGVIYLHFSDIRNARAAVAELQLLHASWHLEFIRKAHFHQIRQTDKELPEETIEARIIAIAACDGPSQAFEVQQVAHMVQDVLTTFGDLLSWRVKTTGFPELQVQADFYDIKSAETALRSHPFKQAVSHQPTYMCHSDRV